jgi:outer membrane protein
MKKLFVSCFFAGSIISVHAQNNVAATMTLQQCVETGIANNLDVQQSNLQMQSNEINWKQARLNRLPDLNGSINHGINQGRSIDPFTNSFINEQVTYSSYGLNSGVVLFNGLSLQNSVKQTRLSYDASKMDWQQAKDNLTINIILAYLQVLSSEDVLTQSRTQGELSKQQVERLEVLDKEGAIVPSQLSDLKGQYANDQLSIINAKNALESAKLNLFQLMNMPFDTSIKLERLDAVAFAEKYESTPATIYQTALQQFAQVKAVDLRTQSAEKAVKVAKGQLFPTLSFGANANTNYSSAAGQDIFLGTTDVVSTDYITVNGTQYNVSKRVSNFSSEKIMYGKQLNNNLFTSVGFNLQIPIFNSLFQQNRIKQAKITLKNNELIAKTTKTQLQQSIEQAYINMTTASERHKTLLEQVDAFTESFRAAEIRFNAGVGNSIDYLTAKNNLDRANVNLINAKYDYVLRTKILDYYQGKRLW